MKNPEFKLLQNSGCLMFVVEKNKLIIFKVEYK